MTLRRQSGAPLAAVDLGSNSFRLLIAKEEGGQIVPISTHREGVRLAGGLDQDSHLSNDKIREACEALARFRERLGAIPADRVRAVATSTYRVARNGEDLLRHSEHALGLPIDIISGPEEARLIYLGCAHTLPWSEQERLIVDIGGGSTEFILGEDGELRFHVSTHLGAVRQSERHLAGDPPSKDQLTALANEATEIIELNVPPEHRRAITHGIAVAGTPTVLAAVDQALDPFDPWKVHGYAITAEACAGLLDRLAAVPLAERRQIVGLHPDRAPTIVAGAAILKAAMHAFNLDSVTVSEHDILYGSALDLAAGG